MPKFLVLWKMEPTMIPLDLGTARTLSAEEMVKGWLRGFEAVKAGMKAGLMKDFGVFAGGGAGYGIWEVASEAELFTHLLKYIGVNFEVKPVLTVDQCIEAFKKSLKK